MRYPRQNKILELINRYEIETQDKLAAMLKDEGFDVTQATISRDIKELQLVKVLAPSGRYKYAESKQTDGPITKRFIHIFRETVLSISPAKNLLLIKTLSGCGGAAGEAIDNLGIAHMVGTVGGDNTVLVILEDDKYAPEIMTKLNSMLTESSGDSSAHSQR
ncbi:MAG: arginine repressor [Eubacteriales bacterium]|nr:arginine repressor [Eubacteriales bacterium]